MRHILGVIVGTLALASCAHDHYDFQPETDDKDCGVVTYDNPNNNDDGPIGRYCRTDEKGDR